MIHRNRRLLFQRLDRCSPPKTRSPTRIDQCEYLSLLSASPPPRMEMGRIAYLSLEITSYSPDGRSSTRVDQVQIDLSSQRIRLPHQLSTLITPNGEQQLTALSRKALRINLPDSNTSSNSTLSQNRILACASLNRIILSNCLVVAVILFSCVRESEPSLRIST